jgi:beta-glucosidase
MCILPSKAQYQYFFQDPSKNIEDRIDSLLALLTVDEKLSWMDQHQSAITRLGIPYFTTWTEGLHGLAWAQVGTVTATQFPQAGGMAATWDPKVIEKAGFAEGYEARVYYQKYSGKGIGLVIRAPMIDMGRDIRWGRCEESLGEDPFLVGEMGKGLVRGLQGYDTSYLMTATTLKHFLANNNEKNRDVSNSQFDQRNLWEYYLPPFRECLINANARSLMTAYNLVNDTPAIISPIINKVLIGEWGFDGMVCTDSYASYNLYGSQKFYSSSATAAAQIVKAGTSVFVDYDKTALKAAYTKGLITESIIDKVIRGNVKLRFQLGLFDPAGTVPYDTISANSDPWNSNEHKAIALEVAEKSIVLLKNDSSFLPLKVDSVKSIAVIGPNAANVFRDWYGGNPPYTVSILQGLQNKLNSNTKISNASGVDTTAAVTAADTSDFVVVCLGNHPTCGNYNWGDCDCAYEGRETVDRTYIELEPTQIKLLKKIFAVNRKTVVVMVSSYPQAINWIQDSIPAILQITHSCQEQGNAVANALLGKVNPGGKTIFTWPSSTSELPGFMDYNIRNNRTYMYYTGKPLYPFGYGLSYTNFLFSDMVLSSKAISKTDTLKIKLKISNTGNYDGDEVVQVYVRHLGSKVVRPVKELKAFERITVAKDSAGYAHLSIPVNRLSYWDESVHSYIVEKESVEIQAGNSSSNILLRDTIVITDGGAVQLVPNIKEPEDTTEEEKPTSLFAIQHEFSYKVVYIKSLPYLVITINRPANLDLTIYSINGIPIDKYSYKDAPVGTLQIPLGEHISTQGIYLLRGIVGEHTLGEKFMVK